MRFYYTGVDPFNTIQKNPSKSLGGFRANNVVPNGDLRNLFSDITFYTVEKNRDEISGIMLRNETGKTVEAIEVWFEYPELPLAAYEIAFTSVNEEEDGTISMEKIPNNTSMPYYAEFSIADGESNKILLDGVELPPDGHLGIWIKRKINQENVDSQFDSKRLCEEHLELPLEEAQATNRNVAEIENICLNITWEDQA